MKEKTMKKAMDKPKKGQDTWGIKERSSWNGGEYKVYGQSAVEEEKERKRRLAVAHTDLGTTSGRGRDGRDSSVKNKRLDLRRGTDDRRERDADRDRQTGVGVRQSRNSEGDWPSTTSSSKTDEDAPRITRRVECLHCTSIRNHNIIIIICMI